MQLVEFTSDFQMKLLSPPLQQLPLMRTFEMASPLFSQNFIAWEVTKSTSLWKVMIILVRFQTSICMVIHFCSDLTLPKKKFTKKRRKHISRAFWEWKAWSSLQVRGALILTDPNLRNDCQVRSFSRITYPHSFQFQRLGTCYTRAQYHWPTFCLRHLLRHQSPE